jgi:hypothetical protein
VKVEEMKPNMVFRYAGSSWCRHGLAITKMQGDYLIATDTYWRDPNMDPVSLSALESAEYLGNLDEFQKSSREECERFEDGDSIFIPIGGGSEQNWLRKSAKPSREKSLVQIAYKIERAESTIRMAKWDLEQLQKEQAKWLEAAEEVHA